MRERNADSSAGAWDAPPPDYYLGSYDQQQSLPAENYPDPQMAMNGSPDNAFTYNYGSLSYEQTKEFFEMTRNSFELLSSILNSETEPKPLKVNVLRGTGNIILEILVLEESCSLEEFMF